MTTIGADETVIQEITIKAPARRIFEALTNPEQRKEWWALKAVFRPPTLSPICGLVASGG